MIALRDYQLQSVEDVRNEIRRGMKRIMLQQCTGGGKTLIAAHIIQSAVSRGKDVLFIANRKELINQASNKMSDFGLSHGIIMAGDSRYRPWESVQVASIQTLARRKTLPEAHIVIIDEAHTATADSYIKLLELYPDAVVLGLSATPVRSNGKPLGDLFQTMVKGPAMTELMDMGFLVPILHYAPSMPDLSGVKIIRGDYDEHQLAEACNKPKLIGDIVGHWKRIGEDRRTIGFAPSIAMSKTIVQAFLNAGIHAEHIDGSMDGRQRDDILARHRAGEFPVLMNCNILVEGYDDPQVSCGILANPTKSLGQYLQMAGRFLRVNGGKNDCILLDHGGLALEHGMVTEDREWSLNIKTKKKNAARTVGVQICDNCFATYSSFKRACPLCGKSHDVQPREIEHDTTSELQLITERRDKKMEQASARTLEDLIALGKSRGYKSPYAWAKRLIEIRGNKNASAR